jgi:hypothetical protein
VKRLFFFGAPWFIHSRHSLSSFADGFGASRIGPASLLSIASLVCFVILRFVAPVLAANYLRVMLSETPLLKELEWDDYPARAAVLRGFRTPRPRVLHAPDELIVGNRKIRLPPSQRN